MFSNSYSSLDPRRSHERAASGSPKKIRRMSTSSDVSLSPTVVPFKTKTYKKHTNRTIESPTKPKRRRKRDAENALETSNTTKLSRYDEMLTKKLDSDSGDDNNDFNVIDITKISSPTKPKSAPPSPKNLNQKIEGLIDISDDESKTIFKTDFKIKPKALVDPSNILFSLQQNSRSLKPEVCRKYKQMKNIKLPKIIKSRNQLYNRAKKHFPMIPKVLSAKQYPSVYYELAKAEASKSQHETMSNDELKTIEFTKFCGGYYGFKRQSLIGSFIIEEFNDVLDVRKNKVIQWWTKTNFATYVLANEIIIRMIQDDLGFTFDQAEKFCQTSSDYGSIVADTIEVENDEIIQFADDTIEAGNEFIE